MSRPCLGRVAALTLLLLAGLGLFMACSGDGNGHSSGAEPAENQAEATRVEQQRDVMSQFLGAYPVKSYASFEEAEQVAGYHIPRPTPEYPIAYNLTHLQWFPQFDRPFSETHYGLPPVGDTPMWAQVNVSPSYFYYEGDKGATRGEPTNAGGKAGWMAPGYDKSWVFIFECGAVDDVKLYCQVMAGKDIGWEAFEHFVSTLQ
jgi:hypothetical protein